jgi:hypothetical protein
LGFGHIGATIAASSSRDGADLLVAGCREIAIAPTERLLQFTIQTPMSVEDFWVLRLEMSDKLREKIGTLSGDQMAEVKPQALESLGEYSTDHGMIFPAEVLIVSGAKNSPR